MIWVAAALSVTSVIAIWVIGGFFSVALVIKILLTCAVLLIGGLVAGLLLYFRYTAARDLENAMMQQGQAQIASARPDRREAVTELQQKMQQAIVSLKRSKLGSHGGASALYALPWYIIVGPPGAGKTTAIKHSGLVFPLDNEQSASSFRGVGGTRNCDWWFTNDAILLDTAGRYATDVNDQDEWLAFLDLLKKYRPTRPINGLIVAISLPDLAVSQDQGIDEIARRIRARVDEIATRIQMLVPIYVVLTKCDLVQGFVEFWGDLRKSERGQIWGMSFPLTQTEEPRAAFEREFGLLLKTLHARTLRRFRGERHLETRQKIAEFPLEVAPLRHHVGLFLQALFQRNRFQETPILRGVYFTSGTQVGRPLARVAAAMAQSFGMRGVAAAMAQGATEPKSFFLTDVFQRVMFKDSKVAGRTEADRQRRLLTRGAFMLSAGFLGACLVLPASCTFLHNNTLVSDTSDIAARVEAVKWGDGTALQDGLPQLDATKAKLQELEDWTLNSTPWGYGWGMYVGASLDEGLRSLYGSVMARAAVAKARSELESRIKSMDTGVVRSSENYSRDYDTLKLYLMLSDPKHMDPDWAAPRLAQVWTQTSHTRSQNEEELILPHMQFYAQLLKRGGIPAWPSDAPLVTRARSILQQVPQEERLYGALVRDANAEIAAVRRENIFYGSIGPFVQSKTGAKVEGAYTKGGWARVKDLLSTQRAKLAAEKWVLGDEANAGAEEAMIAKLREMYFDRYKTAWRNFLADLLIQDPGNAEVAIDELSALSETEWPYLRLLRILKDNVNLDMTEPQPSVASGLVDKAKAEAERRAREEAAKAGIDAGAAAAAKKTGPSPVEVAFGPMVRFGVPANAPANGAAEAPGGGSPTGLSQYQDHLRRLVGVLTQVRDNPDMAQDPHVATNAFQESVNAINALLADQDGFTRPLLSPLLLNPIMFAMVATGRDAGRALGGLWDPQVYTPKWHEKLENRYPFTASSNDAALADFLDFFHPGDGALWGFFDANLKSSIDRSGNKFSASRRMRSSVGYFPEFLNNCLSRGADITSAVFPSGSPGPDVSFDVNLHSVSEQVAEVGLDIEGVTRTYRNEPETWATITWPGKGAHGAKLRVRGKDLNEEIGRQGDFGLFHLLDAADIRQGTAGSGGGAVLVATFAIRGTNPPAQVKLDIRPKREQNPLQSGFFRGYQCPRLIVGN